MYEHEDDREHLEELREQRYARSEDRFDQWKYGEPNDEL